MAKGNMLIAQSGGPSMVINQSLVGAVLAARDMDAIGKIYGACHGIQGILEERLIDLRKPDRATLEAVAATPSSALGSVRRKPTAADCAALFRVLHGRGVRYFFYIGGNDSAETAHIINQEARKARVDIACFHIPKTIDNDLRENDHTPGFGSAARFVALAVMGDTLDNRALGGVKIDVIMGRNAGFLTAAASLARQYPDDGPHLIYLPERPFSTERFADDVARVMKTVGRCVVAVSEGIVDADGTPIASKFLSETDSHGNAQLSGTGALGDLLARVVKEKAGVSRVRADHLRLPPAQFSRRRLARRSARGAAGRRHAGRRHSRERTRQRVGRDQAQTGAEIRRRVRGRPAPRRRQEHPPHARRLHQQGGQRRHPGVRRLCPPARRRPPPDRAPPRLLSRRALVLPLLLVRRQQVA